MSLGFVIVPSLLLRAQRRLGLTPTQLAILMHLLDHWWEVDRKPYPTKSRLGDRLGLGERQIQRNLADLEAANLVKRIPRTASNGGKLANEYDPTGLVDRLQELEPEFREAEKNARQERSRVARPGLRSRRTSQASP